MPGSTSRPASISKRLIFGFAALAFATSLVLLSPSARAQCDETNPRIPPIDCRNPDTAVLHINVRDDKEAGPEPASLSEARQKFWSTYPNAPGHEQARKDFAYQLFQRDLWVMYFLSYTDDILHQKYNFRDTADLINSLALRDKIPDSAMPAFVDFVNAFRESLKVNGGLLVHYGPQNASEVALMEREIAIARHRYFDYVLRRDWAEFDAAGKIPPNFTSSPDAYALLLYARFGRMTMSEAEENLNSLRIALGKVDSAVIAPAASKILIAPKAKNGGLVNHPPEIHGIRDDHGALLPDLSVPQPADVIAVYGDPLEAFEQICARSGDKPYALKLMADSNPHSHAVSGQVGKWAFADKAYRHFVDVYGNAAVLQAAHAVRTATKQAYDGWVMHPEAIGAIHKEPLWAFMDVLARKDPAGPIKLMLAFESNAKSSAEVSEAYAKAVTQYTEPALLSAMEAYARTKPNPMYPGAYETLTGFLGARGQNAGTSAPCTPTREVARGGKGAAIGAAAGAAGCPTATSAPTRK